MEIIEVRPPLLPPALGTLVSGIDFARSTGDRHPDPVGRIVVDQPDHATSLVWRWAQDGRSEFVVLGPRTRAGYHLHRPAPSCLRVRLHPGRAHLLLGRPARDLVDRAVPARAFLGGPADRFVRVLGGLLQRADGDVEPTDLVRTLADALTGYLSDRPVAQLRQSDLVRRATALLSPAPGRRPEPVRAAARRLHVSERQLRNLFDEAVGVSPRHFAQIDRVRGVLARARPGRLAELADGAGYYDQSHLTAEFRRLMGVPPGAFLAGRRPAPVACHQLG